MKKLILTICAIVAISLLAPHSVFAQKKAKKKQTIEVKSSSKEDEDVAKLTKPENDKNNPVPKSRALFMAPITVILSWITTLRTTLISTWMLLIKVLLPPMTQRLPGQYPVNKTLCKAVLMMALISIGAL